MENKKEKVEDFKTAISSTIRSIADSQKIEVNFGNQSSKSEDIFTALLIRKKSK